MPDLLAPLIDWATAHGPPNWVFYVAALTSPRLWAGYVRRAASQLFQRYLGSE